MSCSVEGCDRAIKYAGMCGMHYKRKWRHGNPNTRLIIEHKGEKCSVEGCDNTATELDMCKICRQRVRRFGRSFNIVNRGSGYSINTAGYIVLQLEDGSRQYEHIVLAEKALGRKLPKGAVIHHTSQPHDNFGPFKLVICPDQAYHLLLHRRAKALGYA